MKLKLLLCWIFLLTIFSCKKQNSFKELTVSKSISSKQPAYPNKQAEIFATTAKSNDKKAASYSFLYDFGSYNATTGTTHVRLYISNGQHYRSCTFHLYRTTNQYIARVGSGDTDYEADLMLPVGDFYFDVISKYPQVQADSKAFTVKQKPADPPNGKLNLYRYYNSQTGRHYYSTNWNNIGSNGDNYEFEKIQGVIYANPGTDLVPLYEYYNLTDNDHWYTTNSSGYPGYTMSGIIGYLPTFQTTEATLQLNEYYGSNTGHIYTSPPEYLNNPDITLNTNVGYIIPYTEPITPQPIYLFYNSQTTDHFTSPDINAVNGYSGWSYNGSEFRAYLTQVSGTVPVYEFYSVGDHFNSTNSNATAGYSGWTNNGMKFYVYTTQVTGTIPIYLYYDITGGDHYITSNPNIANTYAGWRYDGIAFYAFSM